MTTATVELTTADLTTPVPCHTVGCANEAAWRSTYRPCSHMHTVCDDCHAAFVWRHQVYPSAPWRHGCCGSGVTSTDWSTL